jgi:hypothetical protein
MVRVISLWQTRRHSRISPVLLRALESILDSFLSMYEMAAVAAHEPASMHLCELGTAAVVPFCTRPSDGASNDRLLRTTTIAA